MGKGLKSRIQNREKIHNCKQAHRACLGKKDSLDCSRGHWSILGTRLSTAAQACQASLGSWFFIVYTMAASKGFELRNDMLTFKMTKSMWPRRGSDRRADNNSITFWQQQQVSDSI